MSDRDRATNIRDEQPPPLVVPLSLDGSELLVFDVGPLYTHERSGWARFHSPDAARAGLTVLLRFAAESATQDAALQVRELHVAADRNAPAFSSPLLRTLPFARMVAAVNRQAMREQLRPLLQPVNIIESGRLGSSMSRWLFGVPPVPMEPPSLVLDVPSDRRRPDDFYALAADTYLAQATVSNHAAQDLADANGVPRSTVHRWLKEARARGLLRLPQQSDANTGGQR